jgi:ABC-type nitrate/sulfonate/bicarbonate transport system ATPase subunit
MRKAALRAERITKLYQGVPVVSGVSLTLETGQFVSILGPSGIGKTTLFNALAGLDPPDSGKVYLTDSAGAEADVTGQAGRVRYMQQKDLLLAHKTIIDNIALPLVLRGVKKNEARAAAAKYFAEFGLSGYEKKYPRQISGGERQRASLLRTILTGDSQVIMLDEPFSALDAITRMRLRKWFTGIARKNKWSVLFVTHDVDEALEISDVIHILNGRPAGITKTYNLTVQPAGKDIRQSILKDLGL